MRVELTKAMLGTVLAATAISQLAPAASAQGYYYNPYYRPSVFTTHPILSSTLLGGAVGTLGGAALGALQEHEGRGTGVATGAAVGGGTGVILGAGVGLLRNKALYGYYGF